MGRAGCRQTTQSLAKVMRYGDTSTSGVMGRAGYSQSLKPSCGGVPIHRIIGGSGAWQEEGGDLTKAQADNTELAAKV